MKKLILIFLSFILAFGISAANVKTEQSPICRERQIGGVDFKFCFSKQILKRNKKIKIQFFAKIPREREIFVTYGDIESEFVEERNELIFYLGGANILGDYIPQFLDLRRYRKTKNDLYRDIMFIKIADLEKEHKIKIASPLTIRFLVSFSKEIKEPLKTILLTEEWYHWGDQKEKWYPDCYASFYENYISDEEVGSIKIEIKE